jgi:hypothetical protein
VRRQGFGRQLELFPVGLPTRDPADNGRNVPEGDLPMFPQKTFPPPWSSTSRDDRAAKRGRRLSGLLGPLDGFSVSSSSRVCQFLLSSLLFFDSCFPMIFQSRGVARCKKARFNNELRLVHLSVLAFDSTY